jgi:hypothetical protein
MERQPIKELRRQLEEYKAKGFEVVPVDECDNYDKTGRCQGHDPVKISYNKNMKTLEWLIKYLEEIDYFNKYPTRRYIQEAINDDTQTPEYKVKLIVCDGLVQTHLYGDVLSTIDLSADPVEYFYSHVTIA